MGCASSKIDDLPAVLLCRERLHHLSQALHHRYSLAEAHLSYIHSLQSLGLSLHHFFDTAASLPPPPSPPLNLPPHRKIANDNPAHPSSSHSNSGSHLNFHSDSEDDDDERLHDHGSGSESGSGHLHLQNELEGPTSGGMMMYEESGFVRGGSGFGSGMGFNPYLYSSNYNNGYNINYMKKHVTPSVSYEQKPVSYDTQTVQFGDPSSTSNSNYYDYFVANNNGYMSSYGGVGYFEGAQKGGGGGGGGGGWNSGMAPQKMGPTKQQAAPPPPPPPATSAWDFMNLFESIEENHYPIYKNRTPSSRDSREVREEEGIPDLEDGDYAHEVVKEVHGHQKLVVDESGSSGKSGSSISSGDGGEEKSGGEPKRGEVIEEEVVGVSEVESGNVYRGRPSASIESAPVEYEVRMVDTKVVGDEGKGDGGGKGGGGEGRPGFRNVLEVVKEIQVQFERAANSGGELGNVLEIGKLRYQRKNAAHQG